MRVGGGRYFAHAAFEFPHTATTNLAPFDAGDDKNEARILWILRMEAIDCTVWISLPQVTVEGSNEHKTFFRIRPSFKDF